MNWHPNQTRTFWELMLIHVWCCEIFPAFSFAAWGVSGGGREKEIAKMAADCHGEHGAGQTAGGGQWDLGRNQSTPNPIHTACANSNGNSLLIIQRTSSSRSGRREADCYRYDGCQPHSQCSKPLGNWNGFCQECHISQMNYWTPIIDSIWFLKYSVGRIWKNRHFGIFKGYFWPFLTPKWF